MRTGISHNYHWLVSRNEIEGIDKVIINHHSNFILHLATFDSGPLEPTDEELRLGWSTDSEIMYSPTLTDKVVVPYDRYDEWYLSITKLTFPKNLDRFVNYGGFNLDTNENDYNWKEHLTLFWRQLVTINPETYVALGDNDIIVSKNEKLIKHIFENA